VANHAGPLPLPAGKGSTAGGGGQSFLKSPDPEIGWMTEAKDWAGELISGLLCFLLPACRQYV
jgi:hypothetical protein